MSASHIDFGDKTKVNWVTMIAMVIFHILAVTASLLYDVASGCRRGRPPLDLHRLGDRDGISPSPHPPVV